MHHDRTDRTDLAPADVAVVGGGLAGLAAACHAAGGSRRVVVLDGHPLGGRARTDRRAGFAFNRGPRALYVAGPGSRVLRDLRIVPRGGQPPARGARGLRGGRLGLLPGTAGSLLRTDLLGARSKVDIARFLRHLPRIDAARHAGTSLADWLGATGLRADAVDLMRAVTRVATYVDDPVGLSADVAIRQVQLALDRGVRYLDGGFQQLVDALAHEAGRRGVDLQVGDGIEGVAGEAGRFELTTSSGRTVTARAVVLAAGSPDATAGLLTRLDGAPDSWSRLAPPPGAACLELGLGRPGPIRTVFGVDVPLYLSHHAPPAQGLAPDGMAVVHVMRYQAPDHPTSPEADRRQLRDLAALAGIDDRLVEQERFLARMPVNGGYPRPSDGGLGGRPPVGLEDRPGLFVAGDWVGPVGFLADAALASGAQAGRRAGMAADRPAHSMA